MAGRKPRLRKWFKSFKKRFKKKPAEKPKKTHSIFTADVLKELRASRPWIADKVLRELAVQRKGKRPAFISHTTIAGGRIRYYRKFKRWVGPKGERISIWKKPILIASAGMKRQKGPKADRVISARHDVYMIEAGKKGSVRIAKKCIKPLSTGLIALGRNSWHWLKQGIAECRLLKQ